jgi:KRAB domain-containing zinc finger protein
VFILRHVQQRLGHFEYHNETHHTPIRFKLECDLCGKFLISKRVLISHFKTIHSITKDEEKYPCVFCDKEFHSLYLLRTHMFAHQKVKCEICNRSFSKNHFKRHMERIHLENDLIQCEKCPKAFKSKMELKQHIYFEHDKKFQCKFCRKNFRSPKELSEHLKVHKNPETFKCEICQKNFASSLVLKTHRKLHENENQEKEFKCDKCKYATNFKSNFKCHQKVHEKYEARLKSRSDWIKCKKCPALLGNRDNYQAHLKRTHGKIKFRCDFCVKSFSTKSDMLRHLKSIHFKHLKK